MGPSARLEIVYYIIRMYNTTNIHQWIVSWVSSTEYIYLRSSGKFNVRNLNNQLLITEEAKFHSVWLL
jgi:hypothetical protein